jgi:dihydropteroate synthase
MSTPHLHFVTGKLAEFSLREMLSKLGPAVGFSYSVDVLNITVAALLTTEWVAPRINVPAGTTRVLLPGYCRGELSVVEQAAGVPVERGPHDLRRLPNYFGQTDWQRGDYGGYDIEIVAEINHAPRLSLGEIVSQARELQRAGADVIDIGCDPGETWSGVGDAVAALVSEGLRVSIDSLNVTEIAAAARAGASLVLSVNSSNRHAAVDWGCEVVAIPDVPATLEQLDNTIEHLANQRVPLRIDPILEPIGFGFAASLGRYLKTRQRYPDAEMLMGIGNLTELTDADSAAINVLLLGFCQELGIRSVLTTQVVNWARSSVRECDLARRLVFHAVQSRRLPKHVEPNLVLLRDERPSEFGEAALDRLASEIRDHNYRLFAEGGKLHALAAGRRWADGDPFTLFKQMTAAANDAGKPIDASHAFYLGYELAKATTALTLDKDYRQDEALSWGFLTRPEDTHRNRPDAKAKQEPLGGEP